MGTTQSPTTHTTTTTTSTTTTTTTTTTTPATTTLPTCWKFHRVPSLRIYKTIKKVKKVRDCMLKCVQNVRCDYYQWKKEQKVKDRECQLMEIYYPKTQGYFSGPRYCI